ncbi:MAG: HAMP domain-containing sensor histidine kinase [Thalassotalea sp.]|nr:HAMP domain-containing sensor histidine kinase [Thalassotalea sp.]
MPSFEKYIPKVIESLRSSYGEEFFNSITLQLDDIINADYTFIARINKEKYTSQTISLVAKSKIADNFEYALQDTPCADVSDDTVCMYPKGICSIYPHDQLLIDMNIEGYVGTPLHDSHGNVMGLIVALYENPIKDTDFIVTLFDFFSGRISAELERYDREKELEKLNRTLEQRVEERTQELTNTLAILKSSQDKLVEQEKMASLGGLVAGVAHEINTPLGVSILSSSNIEEIINTLQTKLIEQTLSKTDLEKNLLLLHELVASLNHNLKRSAHLVQNFKQVAVEHSTDKKTPIKLKKWIENLSTSLLPMTKKHNITLELAIEGDDFQIHTYPAKLSQVFVNLITNAVHHAFPASFILESKTINISAKATKKELILIVSDNGIGIDKNIQRKIFDPFFTTNRASGNTGLGLSIISNIITSSLQGTISLNDTIERGCQFIITLPKE